MARPILIAGNWKMNRGQKETEEFFAGLKPLWKIDSALMKSGGLQAALFPPALSLERALKARGDLPITIGCQNVHFEKSGAFTGEVSAPMLSEIGINWALVGHSERRQYFGETDASACKRATSLIAQGFTVVFCIGETRTEREAGQTNAVLTRQIQEGLKGFTKDQTAKLIIAYEPVWAIGTGLTATPEQAEEAQKFCRDLITKQFDAEIASKMLILYGGSVTPQNVDSLLACPNVDGALVGGASVKPDSFYALVEAGAAVIQSRN